MGIVTGGYLNRDFESRFAPRPNALPPDIVCSDSGGYIIGPGLELRWSQHVALVVEALYKPLHYEDAVRFQDGVVVGSAPATVVTWQFPLLARYQFSLGKFQPFVEAGPSFRATGNLNRADPSHFGVSAGFGLAADWRRLRIAPAVRYTRWAEDGPKVDVRTKPDQVELLVRLGYVPNSGRRPLGRRISLGAVVGATVSNDVRGSTTLLFDGGQFQVSSAGPAAVVGPSVEMMLLDWLSLETNAIPRSFRTVQRTILGDGTTLPEVRTDSGGTWEFPVLAKFRLRRKEVRPFVTAGPSFRLPKQELPIYGGTVGAGVELTLKYLKIAPTVRYTRWGPERPRMPGVAGSGVRRDQIRLLVGISF